MRRLLPITLFATLIGLLTACAGDSPALTMTPDRPPEETPEIVIQDLGSAGQRDAEPLNLPTRDPSLGWQTASEPINAANAYRLSNIGVLEPQAPKSTTFSHAFSVDGTRLVALNNDYFFGWDLVTGQRLFMNTRQGGLKVFFSPDKISPLLLTQDGELLIFGEDGRLVDSLQAHSNFSMASDYDPVYGWLAVGGTDGTVKVWDVLERVSLVTIDAHNGLVTKLAFNGDSRWLASADQTYTVKVWDWQTREMIGTIENGGEVRGIAFNPLTDQIALAGPGYVSVWQVAESGVVFQYTLETGEGGSELIVFSPDGRYLATGGEQSDMALWEAADGTLLAMLPQAGGVRAAATFSASSDILLTSSLNGMVNVFDLTSIGETTLRRAQIQVSDRVALVDMTPDGFSMLFFQAMGDISLWGVPYQVD